MPRPEETKSGAGNMIFKIVFFAQKLIGNFVGPASEIIL
jgi:hypothetical protein